MIMQPSPSLGSTVDIFTGVMDGYGTGCECVSLSLTHMSQGPIGDFDWEVGSGNAPIQDDPALEDYNVQERIEEFVLECIERWALMRAV